MDSRRTRTRQRGVQRTQIKGPAAEYGGLPDRSYQALAHRRSSGTLLSRRRASSVAATEGAVAGEESSGRSWFVQARPEPDGNTGAAC